MAIITREGIKGALSCWDSLILISKVLMKYEELEIAFKAIHDEYVASESFKEWSAAKEAWETTETFKKDPDRYMKSHYSDPNTLANMYGTIREEEDYNVYVRYKYLSEGGFSNYPNLKCPRNSSNTDQRKFALKRTLLLLEHGLPLDTKLPGGWYCTGSEWIWN